MAVICLVLDFKFSSKNKKYYFLLKRPKSRNKMELIRKLKLLTSF